MEKKEFIYQRWYLKILCSGVILPIVYLFQKAISELLDIEIGYYILFCSTIAIIGMICYYKYVDDTKMFLRKGYYWVENGEVYLQRKNKICRVKNVKWLKGDITSAYSSKVAMLVIQYENKKIVLFSKPIKDDIHFSKTDLYPIFETILYNNPQLQKEEKIDYWYEIQKRK